MTGDGQGKFYFITGGARSGKSAFAERLAGSLGAKVTYVATAAPWDDEMKLRITKHQERRPREWATVEEELWVAEVIQRVGHTSEVVLIDCLTLLVTNMFLNPAFVGGRELNDQEKESLILEELTKLAASCLAVPAHVILVSNEVGLGLVPDNAMGRAYRDIAGRANQLMASYAHEVYFTMAGIPVEIKELGRQVEAKYFGKGV